MYSVGTEAHIRGVLRFRCSHTLYVAPPLHVRWTEFLKRGLPRGQIQFSLSPDDAMCDVNEWETAVLAELPDEHQLPEVFAQVCARNVHTLWCGCV